MRVKLPFLLAAVWPGPACGPMPQAFVATVDGSGVALAAIPGLNARLAQQVSALRTRMDQKNAKTGAQTVMLPTQDARVASFAKEYPGRPQARVSGGETASLECRRARP